MVGEIFRNTRPVVDRTDNALDIGFIAVDDAAVLNRRTCAIALLLIQFLLAGHLFTLKLRKGAMAQGSEEWLDTRARHAITWSRGADALGIGHNSRSAYMREKLGITPPPECNWRMKEGNRREPWVGELYYRIMGWCGVQVELEVDSFCSDASDSRMGGSPDRIVRDKLTGETWLLEIKTCPGGDMRTEIPISHLVQMLGLCHTYNLHKAHYICHSQGQGILLSEVYYDPRLWTFLAPKFRAFCDLWSIRAVPGRMDSAEKQEIIEQVKRYSFISEINCVTAKRLQRELQLATPSSPC